MATMARFRARSKNLSTSLPQGPLDHRCRFFPRPNGTLPSAVLALLASCEETHYQQAESSASSVQLAVQLGQEQATL